VHARSRIRGWDPATSFELFIAKFKTPACADPIWSPTSDDELMNQTLAIAERRNIIGVLSGPAARVAANPRRFIRGLSFQLGDKNTPSPATLRAMHARGELHMLGEVANQYAGIRPDDPRMEPYSALAEELDMPVASTSAPDRRASSTWERPATARRCTARSRSRKGS
jgi:predicted TIM-barrel fold metal-dependent hydrolase